MHSPQFTCKKWFAQLAQCIEATSAIYGTGEILSKTRGDGGLTGPRAVFQLVHSTSTPSIRTGVCVKERDWHSRPEHITDKLKQAGIAGNPNGTTEQL
ncbi:hypothetical protein EWB00_001813 [Schistosoma japonicum]|uniref:Uncharacterized protein n=1 Tax=Schistosoma japonicum TaxID=6182 RepID=A0A4Z2CK15_SCHJA|nr:hypothetical protein EWB00_001813 [Schistosoma japonicum]